MSKAETIKDLEDRLKNVIINTCNTIGCKNCGLSWTEDGQERCSATELQSKIENIKFGESKNE